MERRLERGTKPVAARQSVRTNPPTRRSKVSGTGTSSPVYRPTEPVDIRPRSRNEIDRVARLAVTGHLQRIGTDQGMRFCYIESEVRFIPQLARGRNFASKAPGAKLPKFVIRCLAQTRTSETNGHTQLCDSSAIFDLKCLKARLPQAVQVTPNRRLLGEPARPGQIPTMAPGARNLRKTPVSASTRRQ